MNEEQIQNMMNDTYEQTKEDTLRGMVKEFYNTRMRSIVILVWAFALLFVAGAVYSAIQFFKVEEVKSLIMFATIFIVCAHWIDLMKIFAWQMIHKNSIKREIKRMELRIAELSQTVKEK
ncbi:MAG: DUF6768 family protein [Planctomycetota bacterium]|jgi:hypothetical protein